MLFPISLEGHQLLFGGAPMIPLSDTTFAGPFGRIEVVRNGDGLAIHLLIRMSEGDVTAWRVSDSH